MLSTFRKPYASLPLGTCKYLEEAWTVLSMHVMVAISLFVCLYFLKCLGLQNLPGRRFGLPGILTYILE